MDNDGIDMKNMGLLSAFYYCHFKNHYQVLFKILDYLQFHWFHLQNHSPISYMFASMLSSV
jgi:hypothetical protein